LDASNFDVSFEDLHYHIEAAVSFASRSQQSVDLVPEPRNKHDPNAIMVMGISKGWFFWRKHFLGYMPKETCASGERRS
jgi:hypothetical protein